jgi:ribosomal protein L11 methyltransferase
MDYVQISFTELQPEQRDILIARLADAGYEGFEESENGLEAFIGKKEFDESLLHEISFKYQFPYSKKILAATNWNQVWESSFHPIVVDDFVAIRATFHTPIRIAQHEIIITPKMSFGTGHHATTCMMIEQMRGIKFSGKSVLDFGTGTGILAILAEKSGAASITAIDNDEWSIKNAAENFEMNSCRKINLSLSSSIASRKKFDIILANINRNVILENFKSINNHLKIPGILVISGFLKDDEEIMKKSAENFRLKCMKKLIRDNWICMKLTK